MKEHKQANTSTSPKAHAASTKRWEQNLTGLSAELHRIDKNATVYRSRAIKKVKAMTGWSKLPCEKQQQLLDEAVHEVNHQQKQKRMIAETKWRSKHAEDVAIELEVESTNTADVDESSNVLNLKE